MYCACVRIALRSLPPFLPSDSPCGHGWSTINEVAMKFSVVFLLAALLLGTQARAAPAAGVEVRFYPQKQLWSYQLEAARNLHSAVLQNTALINRGSEDVVVGQVRFELLRKDEVVLSRTLHASDLDGAAR